MSKFKGYNPLVGTYTVRRTLSSATYAAWTQLVFRHADWMGGCYQLTDLQKAAAIDRGEVKRVDIRLVAGTEIRVAHQASPGAAWTSADANSRVDRSEFANRHSQWAIFLNSNGGAVTLQVEVQFDIPAEGDIV